MEPIGERLKKIRQEKGISLEEVHKKTKVHLSILKAIEGDSLTNLSPVYLKGFLKIYCKFLGLSPQEYVLDYKEAQSQIKNVNKEEKILQKKPASFLKTTSIKLLSFRLSKGLRKVFIFILMAIFLWLALFNLGKIISSKRKAHLKKEKPFSLAPDRREDKKTPGPKKNKTAAVAAKPQPSEAMPKKESSSGIRLSIRAYENCWVFLKVDGRVVFQRVIEKGRSESWQAKEKIELSLGNAGGVALEVNGQVFSNLGRRGQARKNILITKEGLNIGR